MPARRYDSYKLNRGFIFFITGLLLFLLGIGILAGTRVIGHPTPGPPTAVIFVWVSVLVWVIFYYLRLPVEISLQGQDTLVFKSFIGSSTVAIRDIISLKATPFRPGFIILKHRDGTIRLLCQITGFYELVYLIREINPEIEIQGC